MNYLDLEDFLYKEITPFISDEVHNYIDAERPEDYFECREDVDDFYEMVFPDELNQIIHENFCKLVKECKDEYDFSLVDDTNTDNLFDELIYKEWEQYKSEVCELLYDKFDREESFEEFIEDYED